MEVMLIAGLAVLLGVAFVWAHAGPHTTRLAWLLAEYERTGLLPVISGAAFDSADMLRASSAGNLTATGSGTGLLIDGTPLAGVPIRVHVPQATGTTPTFDLRIQDSPDNSVWTTRYTFAQIIAAGQYRGRVVTRAKYIRGDWTIAGASANFGAVEIGIETGAERAAW